jgi:hypothetical protein
MPDMTETTKRGRLSRTPGKHRSRYWSPDQDVHEPRLRWRLNARAAMPGPAEIRASHEVLEFVRNKPDLRHQVMQLRDAGKSWREVKNAIGPRSEPVGVISEPQEER